MTCVCACMQMKRIPLCLVVGLQRLRIQLRVLILHRCDLEDLEELVVRCGADNSTTQAWTTLREMDISNNRITKLGNSLVSEEVEAMANEMMEWGRGGGKFSLGGGWEIPMFLPSLCIKHCN